MCESGETMEPVLELRGVSKRYADHVALDDVSLSVPRGAFYCLLGPSGCGKTTTLRMVAGLDQPDEGEILLHGERIHHQRPYERNVSTVFQNYALFPHLTAWENIAFGLRRRGAQDIESRVKEVVELVQLGGKESRHPAQLSGGERQRVALARSLVLAPEVLLLDEPLSALDPNLRHQVRSELKSLQRRVGITFLFITHDQEEALSVADSVALMHRGRIEQIGAPEEVYLRPRTKFAASFLGAVNWIDGIGVRPEATRIARQQPGPGARTVAAVVENSVFLGNCLHVETRTEAGVTLVARVSRLDGDFRAGERVHVWWNAGDELRFEEQ